MILEREPDPILFFFQMELKEAFEEARSTGIPIHFLLHQPQFRALCSWMLPYLHFPILPY